LSRRVALLCLMGVVIAVGLGVLVAAFDGGSPATGERTSAGAGPYRGSEPPGRFEMSEFSLRNYDGQLIRSADLRGRVTVLTFLDSQCTESCPVIAWTVARTLDSLSSSERADVRAVAISTDPAEDRSASVRRFLVRNRAVGRLLYLGGGQDQSKLRRVWSAFYVLSSLESGQDALHSAPVRIYDRRGIWVATLHAGADLTEVNLANDIRVALRE
jgi:cytochrome oxidase Cu insertion factor (SCO1/SenC/PrrC family)